MTNVKRNINNIDKFEIYTFDKIKLCIYDLYVFFYIFEAKCFVVNYSPVYILIKIEESLP